MKSTTGKPGNIYKKLIVRASDNYEEHVVTAPRDPKQVENAQRAQKKKEELGHDAFYNVHNHAWTESHFIKFVSTYPDLFVLCIDDGLWQSIKPLLNRDDLSPIPLSVDTTFNLGDFYVTPVTVQDPEFEENPTFTLGFLLHDRKLEETHDEFFRLLVKHLPELRTATNAYFTTDGEKALVLAIQKWLPNIPVFRCWNHVITDCKFKLKKLNITSKETVGRYVASIFGLLRQQTAEGYNKSFLDISLLDEKDETDESDGAFGWDKVFFNYRYLKCKILFIN